MYGNIPNAALNKLQNMLSWLSVLKNGNADKFRVYNITIEK